MKANVAGSKEWGGDDFKVALLSSSSQWNALVVHLSSLFVLNHHRLVLPWSSVTKLPFSSRKVEWHQISSFVKDQRSVKLAAAALFCCCFLFVFFSPFCLQRHPCSVQVFTNPINLIKASWDFCFQEKLQQLIKIPEVERDAAGKWSVWTQLCFFFLPKKSKIEWVLKTSLLMF